MNLAGKPSKLGGTVASVVGWVVLAATLGIAIILTALLQAIFPIGSVVGWAVGGVVAALGIGASMMLLLGGRFLLQTGDKAAVSARRSAILALAENQHGILRASVVAHALAMSPTEAEAALTDISRDPQSGVTLEVDAEGKLYFRCLEIAARFPAYAPAAMAPPPENPRVRVEKVPTARMPAVDAPRDDEDEAADIKQTTVVPTRQTR